MSVEQAEIDAARDTTVASTPPPPATAKALRWLWPALILGIVGLLGAAAHVIGEVREGDTFRSDSAILLAFRRPGDLATPIGPKWLTQSAIDLSALGGFTLLWLLGGFALGYLVYIRRRAEAAWLASSVIGASVVNALLKVFLHRPRPEVVPHLAVVSNASFPSGHAMISAAVYLTLATLLAEAQPRRSARAYLVAFAVALVFLIGCSRIYLGVHWPSDVLAGWCFGAVWALAAFVANRALRRRSAGRPALHE